MTASATCARCGVVGIYNVVTMPTGHTLCESCIAKAETAKASAETAAELARLEAEGDPDAPLEDVFDMLGRFVAYPSEHAHVAHALWILHTHLMGSWDSTPRMAFLSPEPGSGKTRALEVSALLVPNPVEAVNVTPAYLFRKVGDDGGQPTILFDEIDTVFGPKARDNEEIRGLLNAGHRQGATAGRCVVKGRTVETEEIPAYCAVALAGIGDLPDTIITRSVVVRMRRRAPGETIEPFRRRVHGPEGEDLRQRIAIWADRVRGRATGHWPDMPNGIEDRNADVWEPLLTVAEIVGGEWLQRARVSAVTLVTDSMAATPSLGIRLLEDLRTIFGEIDALSTETILEELVRLDESPWGELHGKPITPRGLAQRLRAYDVRSKTVRIGDTTAKGYARVDLFDAWQRYLTEGIVTLKEDPKPYPERTLNNIKEHRGEGVGTPPLESDTSVTTVTDFESPGYPPDEIIDFDICEGCSKPGADSEWDGYPFHERCRPGGAA